ncbi:MAG: hypothetical protein KY456_15350 [Chloroflexi bacterium]|nr:hypothetical protein [Chloroflexota bacterium]
MARQWVLAGASATPDFAGAFYHGSINWLPDDAELPATSDVDVMVVLDDPNPPLKPGKIIYRDILLEISYLSIDQLRPPELVLGQYHLAGSFQSPSIILDPSSQLTKLQVAVARDYAKRRWVRRRCEHARSKILGGFSLRESDPFHDQVVGWLFPAGITTHVLLVAGLKNPTVRRRYVAVRELLADYGRLDFHESLLELLGCAQMSRMRVEHHFAALTEAFDAAKAVVETPFFFISDISDIARPISLGGSEELIARGDYREAIFWMVATYSRCQKVLHHDAPAELRERYDQGYRELLADLGIGSFLDLRRRFTDVETFLPQLWDVAEEIMAANSEIEDDGTPGNGVRK